MAGRKSKPDSEKRRKRIYVYVTDDEYDQILELERILRNEYPTITKQEIARSALLKMTNIDMLRMLQLLPYPSSNDIIQTLLFPNQQND